MQNDLVSDMLVRIKNASLVKHSFAYAQFSTLNVAILDILKKEGYIADFKVEKKNSSQQIKILLKYSGWWVQKPAFSILNRLSKPGQRVYSGYKYFATRITSLKYNKGIAIISTSIGVMSHVKAIQLQKGGEILCYIE